MYIVFELGTETLGNCLQHHADHGTSLSVEELRSVHWCLVTIVCGLHASGYVHFDIRPAHIIRFGDIWKLTDFDGAVKSQTSLPLSRWATTPLYMPPELAYAFNHEQVEFLQASRIMDVWSVGLCALEAVFLMPVLKPWYV